MRIPVQQRRRARIEIVPLIDIVFFLLATFVLVSLSMVKNSGIDVKLPTAKTSDAKLQDLKPLVVSVNQHGDLFLEGEPLSRGELKSALKKRKHDQADLKVLIQGDKAAAFGDAVQVLDEVRQLGITKVAIQTQAVSEKA